ncbi:MAG: carbohydrate ABC transporter permease, partial [Pseudobutyrivibrio ruminis]|nr:carbohydrate ABC transporter permease [Pseudobutyrivibrio ruminis]
MKSLKAQNALQKILFYAGNTIIGVIFVSPLIWMIAASLKPEAKIFANMNSIKTFIPEEASLDNFIEVFRRVDLANVFKNTLTYILLILVLDLLINSICGYALAKFRFRGRKLILSFVVALMVMPMEAILLPMY